MSAAAAPPLSTSRAGIRAFHLTGGGLEALESNAAFRPELPDPPPLDTLYPLVFSPVGPPRPLFDLLDGIDTRPAIVASVRAAMAGQPFLDAARAAAALDAAALPPADRALALPRLAAASGLVAFHPAALPLLYAASLAAVRGQARAAFVRNLESARARLDDLLTIDDRRSPAAQAPPSLAASLGLSAGAYLDASALAQSLHRSHEPTQPLAPPRRTRIEAARADLDEALRRLAAEPAFRLFHPPSAAVPSDFSGLCVSSPAPLDDAAAFLERQLEWFRAPLRALRLARLESSSAYDPSLHDEVLDRLDWRAASNAELAALPAVAALIPSGPTPLSLDTFSRVLRAALPLHILAASTLDVPAPGHAAPDLATLALAHREAFAAQCSMARPTDLLRSLDALASSPRPAVAVVAVPAPAADPAAAWRYESALASSSAFPAFVYDPARGPGFAARFELLAVSPPDAAPITAAHAAALSPALRKHFRLLPDSAWDNEQIELAAWLDASAAAPVSGVPYLWVLDESGARRRAVLSRDLAALCLERRQAARWLRDLAAPPPLKPEPAAHPGDHRQARLEGARQAIERVVSLLTGAPIAPSAPSPAAAPPPAAAPAPKPPAPPAPAPAAPVAPASVAAAPAPAGPYIDSFLCTSCNDCRKINPRMFGYDANQQAFIADASAGTFAELVKAAEGCPARCIHPGSPRPGDRSATQAMIARAAKFS